MNSTAIPSQVQAQCVIGLRRGFENSSPKAALDDKGYASSVIENLVPGVSVEDFELDLSAGAGSELDGKFRAAHSSSALAVNTFGYFRRAGLTFPFGAHRELNLVGFEQTFPTGLARAQPPHLDVVARGPGGLVAIESKCTEFIVPKPAKFSDRYRTEITDSRAEGPWYREMIRLLDGGVSYRFLDAAQLIKHALGLITR